MIKRDIERKDNVVEYLSFVFYFFSIPYLQSAADYSESKRTYYSSRCVL